MTTGTRQPPTELRNWWHDKVHNIFWGELFNHPKKDNGYKFRTAFIMNIIDIPGGYIIEDLKGNTLHCYFKYEQVLLKDIEKGGQKL